MSKAEEVANRIQRQLEQSRRLFASLQLVIGLAFPVVEAILVNMATNQKSLISTPSLTLLGVVALHLALLAAVLRIENPLPHFSAQLYERESDLRRVREEVETYRSAVATYESDYTTYVSVVLATVESLVNIDAMKRKPVATPREAFKRTLSHWIDSRTSIFWFRDGNAYYNFAVYLFKDGKLHVELRCCDSRIQTNDREWEPGQGHVGYCFQHGRTIVPPSSEATPGPEQQYIETSEEFRRPRDEEYYKSFAATPITVNKEKKGVFVVTSSKADQFSLKFHRPIMDTLGILLAQALESCQEER